MLLTLFAFNNFDFIIISPPVQASVLDAWKGQKSNTDAAKAEFRKRAKANGAASLGQYMGDLKGMAAEKSLHVANHAY